MILSMEEAARALLQQDKIVILAHKKPDGDTIGSAFGLLFGLESLGKRARVECADSYTDRYGFLCEHYEAEDFEPEFVVAVDVASSDLLGAKAAEYPQVDLCIDHHKSNTLYATRSHIDASAGATAEIVLRLLQAMDADVDPDAANALFTGITTDTGCFRFANVTAETHRLASELILLGADHNRINKRMFDMKSRGRLDVEKLMMDSLGFYLDGRCAMVSLPGDITGRFGVTEEELDGISSFPRRIEGVLVGITIRQTDADSFRISLRADEPADASRICSHFGGGGHTGAAGCTMTGSLADVQVRLVDAVREELQTVCDDVC